MHGYAHKSQTRERSDIPANVGRKAVVPEGLIGRMDRGRQLAARFGRGLVKAMTNVALDASVQFSCAHVHTLQFVVAGRSTELENVFQLCGAGIKSTGARYGGGARCSSRPRTRRRRTSVIIVGCRRSLESVHRARVCRCGCCGVGGGGGEEQVPVSYTHLTLPTILRV